MYLLLVSGPPKMLRPVGEGGEEEEEYQSDFESVRGSEPDQLSDHLPGDEGAESVSEVPEETLESHVSQGEGAPDHSSRSWCSPTSDHSGTSRSCGSSGPPTGRGPSSAPVLRKDAAVQTETAPQTWWSAGEGHILTFMTFPG